MKTTYSAVMLTKMGGPEVLRRIELQVEAPGPGQLGVRVRAAGVGSTDLSMLTGAYLYAPKIPFVPGYEIAGIVDAVGAGVSGSNVGQRVTGERYGRRQNRPHVLRQSLTTDTARPPT